MPPSTPATEAADCLTTTMSLTASSLGRNRFAARPSRAVKVPKDSAEASSTAPSAALRPSPQLTPRTPRSRQGAVSSSWKPAFTSRICPALTGASRKIHRFWPSRLTEEAVTATVERVKANAAADRLSRGRPSAWPAA